MKKEFKAYFDSLGVDEIIMKRINQVIEFYEKDLNTGEITDVFINDYFTLEGIREFGNLCLFNENYVMEAHNFLIKDNDSFDFVHIDTGIVHLEISKKDFNMKDIENGSRLNIDATLKSSIRYAFKAARNNCSQLSNILKKYLIPKVIKI